MGIMELDGFDFPFSICYLFLPIIFSYIILF